MTKNTLLFLALSIGFGLAAVYLANNWLNANASEPDKNKVAVVEAAQTIPVGSIISAKQIRTRQYPADLAPENTFSDLQKVVGKVTKETLYSGDVIRAERVIAKGEGGSLASLIGENKRALTIRVNDVVGVAGFLLPGDKVDILNTFKKGETNLTEIVLANVKILAIDQTAQNNENRPRVVRAVTVEVTLEQAEELMNARSRGGLQLALRNPIDNAEVEIAQHSAALAAEAQKAAEVVPPPPVRAYISPKVHLIRGSHQEVIAIKAESAGGK
ncbi:Flp pilus assembly protein CpaB [Alteromonas ponticola]|uniref:Flp pilus assembly protein CpaB n=1 Tax=Alteromonas aquimaris TaxID=2998417 RepID=A0ABT3P9A9_9ALTE|nr:Flp pilus assembly protein CpaB [Alteromonas aquimaris]MCW8109361.1 Flp pilus assembly protein CpaB [Alteromonas aquimaris]